MQNATGYLARWRRRALTSPGRGAPAESSIPGEHHERLPMQSWVAVCVTAATTNVSRPSGRAFLLHRSLSTRDAVQMLSSALNVRMRMYSQYKVRMLGTFRFERKGEVIAHLHDRKWDQLLALLLLRGRDPIPKMEVARTLWPSVPQDVAVRRLGETVFKLKEQCAAAGMDREGIVTVARGRVHAAPSLRCDVYEFERLAQHCLGEPSEMPRVLVGRLDRLFDTGLLPGVGADWVQEDRSKLMALKDKAIHAVMAPAGRGSPGLPYTGLSVGDVGTVSDAALAQDAMARRVTRLLELAEGFMRNKFGVDRDIWYERIESQDIEIRGAMNWALDNQEYEFAVSLAGAFWVYWHYKGVQDEWRVLVERALVLANGRASKKATASALQGSGSLATAIGDHAVAERRLDESLRIWKQLQDQDRIGSCIYDMACLERSRGNHKAMHELLLESLEIHERVGSADTITKRLIDIGQMENYAGNSEFARECLDRALPRAERTGGWTEARAKEIYGEFLMYPESRDLTRAEEMFRGSLKVFEESEQNYRAANCLKSLGIIRHWQNRFDEAEVFYKSALKLARRGPDPRVIAAVLRELGDLEADRGNFERGLELVSQSVSMFRAFGFASGLSDSEETLESIRQMRGAAADGDGPTDDPPP